MNIDEAIKKHKTMATKGTVIFSQNPEFAKRSDEEHGQIAEWLEQLKEYQELEQLIGVPLKELAKIFRQQKAIVLTDGDLISRGQLLKSIESDDALMFAANMEFVIGNIKNAPAAYNVDKVVEQLKERKSLYKRLQKLHDRDCLQYGYKIETLNDAIEMVKAGVNIRNTGK